MTAAVETSTRSCDALMHQMAHPIPGGTEQSSEGKVGVQRRLLTSSLHCSCLCMSSDASMSAGPTGDTPCRPTTKCIYTHCTPSMAILYRATLPAQQARHLPMHSHTYLTAGPLQTALLSGLYKRLMTVPCEPQWCPSGSAGSAVRRLQISAPESRCRHNQLCSLRHDLFLPPPPTGCWRYAHQLRTHDRCLVSVQARSAECLPARRSGRRAGCRFCAASARSGSCPRSAL